MENLLTPAQQSAYLQQLLRGYGPSVICEGLGVTLDAVGETLLHDAAFQQQFDRFQQLMDQNVATALYQQAVKGNVTAMKYWLEKRPPPEWNTNGDNDDACLEWDQLTDDQLLDQARQAGIAIPSEFAPRLAATPADAGA